MFIHIGFLMENTKSCILGRGLLARAYVQGRVSDFIEAISYTHGTGRQSNSYHLNGVRIHSSGCNDTKSCTSGRG